MSSKSSLRAILDKAAEDFDSLTPRELAALRSVLPRDGETIAYEVDMATGTLPGECEAVVDVDLEPFRSVNPDFTLSDVADRWEC